MSVPPDGWMRQKLYHTASGFKVHSFVLVSALSLDSQWFSPLVRRKRRRKEEPETLCFDKKRVWKQPETFELP